MDVGQISKLLCKHDAQLRELLTIINNNELGFCIVVNNENVFLYVVTDGDVRRAILSGKDLDALSGDVFFGKTSEYVFDDASKTEIYEKFDDVIRILPILNREDKRVRDIVLFDSRNKFNIIEPDFGEQELENLTRCIESGWISGGNFVKEFEEKVKNEAQIDFASSCTSGTAALHLALLALGIEVGDEVILPSLSFIASANAISYIGAKPIFVDVCEHTWNIDPEKVKEAITPKTKAILAVHLYGLQADMPKLKKIASENGLFLIEDAAEAQGSTAAGYPIGHFSDIVTFSFFGNKIITTGEGGMVLSDNEDLIEQVNILKAHGMRLDVKYKHDILGYNYRMTNIQAAIGSAQMDRFPEIIRNKIEIGKSYIDFLSESDEFKLQQTPKNWKNVYWLNSIVLPNINEKARDKIVSQLALMGIETRPIFYPIHQQKIYHSELKLPITESIAYRGISLPSSPNLQIHQVQSICNQFRKTYEELIHV